ncbi:MAG: hypothetical protein ABW221_09635 [Vicinamibacteria bacterium]
MSEPSPRLDSAPQADPIDHELLRVFDESGFRLCPTLYEMLNEHYSHRTERRGAGYTQATRFLADFVNRPRRPYDYEEALIFADRSPAAVQNLIAGAAALGVDLPFRNLDQRDLPEPLRGDPAVQAQYARLAAGQAVLRTLAQRLEREESRLLAGIVIDLVLARATSSDAPELRPWPEKLAIGTCPLAEKYFLELAQGFVRRKGRMNVIVSDEGEPLLVEKLGLGDDHSCLSVVPLLLNGVRLPRGSLFGVAYAGEVGLRANTQLAGVVIPIARCQGFRFLRLTTLAVSPANRKRAFSSHFEAQVEGGLFEPGSATIEQIGHLTRLQLGAGA